VSSHEEHDMQRAVDLNVTAPAPTPGPAPAPSQAPQGRSTVPRRPAAVLVIILVSYLMIVLDISIVITALPKMQDTLGLSTTSLSWVQNAYTLAFGGLLLLGQGATLGPLTAAGIAGVQPRDAGAASGLVNTAHQLGGSLGLGALVTVFAAATAPALDAPHLFAHRVAVALTVGTGLLAAALVLILALVLLPARTGKFGP
jgi:hypothetical protein